MSPAIIALACILAPLPRAAASPSVPAASPFAAPTPRTMDLVPYARRSLHGFMVDTPEPVPGHAGLLRACFNCMGLPVPVVGHAQWDWGDCTGRAVEEWIFVRQMTGDRRFGSKVEEGQRAALLWILAPKTGMAYVPDYSDPGKGVYYYQMWDQGRVLRALVRWWMEEPNPARKAGLRARIEKMIAGLSRLATHGHDAHYGDYAVYPFDWTCGARHGNDIWCMRGGQLLEPLAMYWDATGGAAALKFAREICAGVLSGHEGDTYPEPTRRNFVYGPDGSFAGHFHDHVSIALGVARFGAALYRHGKHAEGLRLLRWAKKVYDWTRSPANVNAGSSWGWFPENVGLDNTQAREESEICAVADMIQFAAALAECSKLDPSLASWDSLWDDVERYTVNTIVPAQFTITPRYRHLLAQVLAATPVVHNGYIDLEVNAAGCYNHEMAGHQTLNAAGQGHLSQFTWAVEYDGARRGFVYAPSHPVEGKGVAVETPAHHAGGFVSGADRTDDGALRVEWQNRCGRGPYVLRCFRLVNTGKATLRGLRFACVANLDFSDYQTNLGVADAALGRAVVTSATQPGFLAMSGAPAPSFVDVGDAEGLMRTFAALDGWQKPQRRFRGNAATALGWSLGDLAPGQAKTVTVTLAVAGTPAELDRALAHDVFPARPSTDSRLASLLAVAKRLDGAWVASFPPNDLVSRGPDGRPMFYMGGCCDYSGVRGLWACWRAAIADDGRVVSSRLPLCREAAAASQTVTEGPTVVRQRLRLKAPRDVRIRIPDWAKVASVKATLAVGPSWAHASFTAHGRWLDFGRLAAGTDLLVTYPLASRVTRERVGGSGKSIGFSPAADKRTFTAHWRGDVVVSLTPRGDLMPIFP